MQNIRLGFFIGVAMMAVPFVSKGQSNSLGDRGPTVEEQSHKIQKQRVTRKQKLLFRKPSVRHTAEYEYYKNVEQTAREKQQQNMTRKQKPLFRKANVSFNAEYEFYKRVAQVAREKQRMLRKMAKPQYSNFAYFGHKHPPKKHLPFAMRYCKECGIRH